MTRRLSSFLPTHNAFRNWLFLLLFTIAAAQCTLGANNTTLIIAHATLIDMTGAPARPDVTVVVTNDQIAAIGKTPPPLATHAVVLDATGKFLIPGLWDMHVHWYEKDYLPLFIANGVTGIRIMWGMAMHHEWRKEIEQGALLGPRMLIASTIVDGPKPIWPGSGTASNAAEGRQAVIEAKKSGADFVKVYSLLPREAYFAIADESRKQGIPFEGHVPISVSVEEASAAGQKTIEHLTGVLPACSSREAELLKSDQAVLAGILTTNSPKAAIPQLRHVNELALETYSPSRAQAIFGELKTNHTWQCPTLTVLRLATFSNTVAVAYSDRLKFMPSSVRSEWLAFSTKLSTNKHAGMAAFGRKYFQKELEIVGAMQRAGVEILAGTDTGNPFCFPGFGLHDELELLVKAGLTPMQALQAATINPARFMNRENELGTIEKGKLADLVLLDANPLDDIANTRKINAVVYRGKLYSRHALDEMLDQVKALARRKPSDSNASPTKASRRGKSHQPEARR